MIHVIINPAAKSGRGMRLWEQLEEVLREQKAGYQVHFTRQAGDAGRYATELTAGADTVKLLVCGGDGTLNEVLQGIRELDNVELYYIPHGSANDFARDFPEKGTPQERLRRMLNQQPCLVDIGVARILAEDGTEYVKRFAGSSGIGYDAAVCEAVDRSVLKKGFNKIGLGKCVYLAVALRKMVRLDAVPVSVRVDQNEPVLMERCLFSAFMVRRYAGGGFMFCPDADGSDGELDLCLVNNITRRRFLRIMPSAFSGKHVRFSDEIRMLRGKDIHVRADRPMFFHVDGEVVCRASQLWLSCLKQKLKLHI